MIAAVRRRAVVTLSSMTADARRTSASTVPPVANVAELTQHFVALGSDHRSRSPFYARLCESAASDPEIVAILESAPEEQQLPVLLMAAVHSIVLAEPDLELAAYYPTVAPEPRSGEPFPAFQELCHRRADELRGIVARRQVQTNEVGRSAIFLPALAALADVVGPLALVDVGTSAGLNLQLDRFEYRYSPGGVVGSSRVVLETMTYGDVAVPRSMPTVTARLGIDRSPIDASDPDDARWLMACVWPDQHDRFERLRGALAIAKDHPVEIRAVGAIDGVAPAVADVANVGHPVVLNSWVLNYLSKTDRCRYVDALDAIGGTRDLTWLYAEAPALCDGVPFGSYDGDPHDTCLTSTTWRSGERATKHLATAHPHGYWLRWGADHDPANSAP